MIESVLSGVLVSCLIVGTYAAITDRRQASRQFVADLEQMMTAPDPAPPAVFVDRAERWPDL